MSAILDSLGVDVKAGRVALETLWMAPLGERHPCTFV